MKDNLIRSDKYYKKLGFKCGLEIHQQLLTEKKLFCRCKAVLHKDKPSTTLLRHMRPTLSELGEYDGTALMEFKTKKNVIYQLYNDTICTYEMDDTPPFQLNQDALDISIEIALLTDCSIVDEIHISRKQYLDGSIPTGFQRTGIIGIEGSVSLNGKKLRIIQLSLEEDACREVSDIGHTIVFNTDRLSIPLVEVVTYPDIKTPKESMEFARCIGRLLRSTQKVRRGLGSVRQDVNVSINGGTRVELKGVPKLQYISKAVAIEAERQKALLEIKKELKSKGVTKSTFQSEFQDVTSIFKKSKSKIFKEVVNKKEKVYGIILRLFAGILDLPTQPGKTFLNEISGRVKVIACIDKLPNITSSENFKVFDLQKEEISKLKKLFNFKTTDTIVLVWGKETDVKTAIKEIKIRAVEATIGVPSETRQVFSDGTNTFERILPGPDRMYPDTDTPPTPITEKHLERIRKNLPERLWNTEKRLEKMGLSKPLIKSLSISKNLKIFNKIVNEIDINPTLVAVTLEEKLKYLKRKGRKVYLINNNIIFQLFKLLKQGKYSKEAIIPILGYLTKNPDKNINNALEELKIEPMTINDLTKLVTKEISKYPKVKKTEKIKKIIMGEVMKTAKNRIDGKLVYEVIESKLSK